MKKTFSSLLAVSLLSMGIASVSSASSNLGSEVLAPKDGWAAYGTGTTGGATADASHVFTVTNKAELLKALGNGKDNTPKIIYVKGTINFNVDSNNTLVGPEFYADPAYDFNAYLEAYKPEVWGHENEVSGPLEDARARSAQNQKQQIVVNIGSNTSIVGLGDDAKIIGGSFIMSGVENIIIRNIEFEAPVDFFPQWDPTDGEFGEWNSEYDNVTVTNNSHNVWIDHNKFTDGEHHDEDFGKVFERTYQQHDGLLDVTNGADYVTISYNVLEDHDKTSLIGSSDSRKSDEGHLKVTIHHNYYKNLTQRLPRVRYGQVHVYNNYYEFNKDSDYKFDYALGVGVNSKIYAENNYFNFDFDVNPGEIIKDWKGTSIYESGSFVNGKSSANEVDLVEAFNQTHTVQLNENVGWEPSLFTRIDPTQAVPALVKAKAGTGKLK